jgi:hypothetical protein
MSAPCQKIVCATPDELRQYSLEGFPPLPQPASPPPDVAAKYLYVNQTIYRAVCSNRLLQTQGTLPSWITADSDGIGLNATAGFFVGATQAEANQNAQNAVNDFVSKGITSGTLNCDLPTQNLVARWRADQNWDGATWKSMIDQSNYLDIGGTVPPIVTTGGQTCPMLPTGISPYLNGKPYVLFNPNAQIGSTLHGTGFVPKDVYVVFSFHITSGTETGYIFNFQDYTSCYLTIKGLHPYGTPFPNGFSANNNEYFFYLFRITTAGNAYLYQIPFNCGGYFEWNLDLGYSTGGSSISTTPSHQLIMNGSHCAIAELFVYDSIQDAIAFNQIASYIQIRYGQTMIPL